MESTQQQVYDISVGDKLVNNIFRGINFTIMAYGQTASGKSHTMQGYNSNSSSGGVKQDNHQGLSEHDGIIPRALRDLFKRKIEYQSSGKGNVTMEFTFVELYNEEMRDLLQEEDDENNTFRPLKMIDQGKNGGVA